MEVALVGESGAKVTVVDDPRGTRDHGAEIVVIIIPTKIRVFAE